MQMLRYIPRIIDFIFQGMIQKISTIENLSWYSI